MPVRCVALLSGGLDSLLAVRILQQQAIEVEALHLKTAFASGQDRAGSAARELGVRLTVLPADEEYLDLIKYPRFGYGAGANPCVDCRIYLFQRARGYLERTGAQFVVSGEIVGQRLMSQQKRDLAVIAFHAGLEDRILRPLSAKLLPPTVPERNGWVDRGRLYGFRGRGRRPLIALARQFGLPDIPTPSTCCALADPVFARKVQDLIQWSPSARGWDFELLKVGRHFRCNGETKVVLGRNRAENDQLECLYRLPDAIAVMMLVPENFRGPRALLVGRLTPEAMSFASGLILRYSKQFPPGQAFVRCESAAGSEVVAAERDPQAGSATSLAAEPTARAPERGGS